ncbi:restriction endonuclease subunit S [Streptomyces mirabilis]|uniref:restriction endonuclease subunit S n=1 Tax=Streptomyces mirabilis TaxID=68239 RepID=UPI00364D1DC0
MTYSQAKLGSLASFLSGFPFKSNRFNSEGTGMPLVRIRDVTRGTTDTYYDGEFEDRYIVNRGDYLIGMDGEFNLAQWRSDRALLNQRVCKIDDVSPELDRHYLARFLPLALKKIEDATPFATVKHLSVKTLRDIDIPLPSLDEQRRIAYVLNQVDELRARRRAAIALLNDLTQSVFLDMFGNVVSNDRQWLSGQVEDLVAKFTSGKSLAAAEEDGPDVRYRILKVSAVTSGRFDAAESKPAPVGYEPPSSHFVHDGDLVFSRANTEALIGATALAVQPPRNLLLPDKLWKFVWHADRPSHPLYVRQLFLQREFRREVGRRASGTSGSMKNISQPKVLSIACGIPPVELQHDYGKKVEAVERLAHRHRVHLEGLDALFDSFQHRAFRDELHMEAVPPAA